jgi:signal transduction histidine kinase/ActR/RegA family two-component response regulator
MRRWFRALPIRRKLVAMTAASTAVALLIAGGGFIVWDIIAFRRTIAADAASQSRIIGENAAPALVFADERATGETLAALELRPRVVMGCVYSALGRLFATYHRDKTTSCPAEPPTRDAFTWDYHELVTPITYTDTRVGALFIQRDLSDVRERLLVGLATVAGLVLLCGLIALSIGTRLQRSIVEPMLQLADTARAVSERQEMERRLVTSSTDELGVVQRAFNDMLDRVAQRTDDLSRANADLQREIDERKRVEAERTMLLARERDANRLKDEFLATLSHELRTPLNAVLGWTRVLRTATVPRPTQARALESIERNARAQARLIEDLLEVSRIVTGKLRLQVRPTDLAVIVDAAIEVTQPAAAAKQIRVTSDIAVRPAMTSGDPDRLQQVVWNLLSNAVKFTPTGGEVAVSLRRDRGFVLSVRDTGIGIDPAFVTHMFEPFRQADGSTSREHGGLGLGLAIVRQIVELHGGTVRAESAGKDKGAMFEVHLPSEVPSDALSVKLDTSATALPAAPVEPDLLRGVRLLVVDDEEDALELLRTTFESYGATVYAVNSVADALAVFDRVVPDVLVSDIGMPVEDGYSLIARVRTRTAAQGGAVPAVALTAYASPTDRLAVLAAGYQAHVSKPYEPFEVVTLIDRLARSAATH